MIQCVVFSDTNALPVQNQPVENGFYCETLVTTPFVSSFLSTGSTLAATCVQTGITGTVWASQRRRPRRWTTTSVWSVNGVRRAAQRSCTASVRRRTTSPSKELQECVCVCLCVTGEHV